MTMQMVKLGSSDIEVPAIGVGTWQWGDRFWAYGKGYGRDEVGEAFEASLDAGLTLFDTAELYGFGESERILGALCRSTDRPVVIASKYMPVPWRLTGRAFRRALRNSLSRLGIERLDLYQIHQPIPARSIEALMDSMAEAVQAGLVKTVGVSNYDLEQMRRAHAALARHGISLASNQVPYHLLDQRYRENGVLDACRELDITLIAYSPLAQGVLTGKYHQEGARPVGIRRRMPAFRAKNLQRTRPLIETLQKLAEQYGKTPAQIALNWLVRQPNVLPIPGAKNARQAADNAGALGWQLSDEEAEQLSQLAMG